MIEYVCTCPDAHHENEFLCAPAILDRAARIVRRFGRERSLRRDARFWGEIHDEVGELLRNYLSVDGHRRGLEYPGSPTICLQFGGDNPGKRECDLGANLKEICAFHYFRLRVIDLWHKLKTREEETLDAIETIGGPVRIPGPVEIKSFLAVANRHRATDIDEALRERSDP